jgi:hypothetical protein
VSWKKVASSLPKKWAKVIAVVFESLPVILTEGETHRLPKHMIGEAWCPIGEAWCPIGEAHGTPSQNRTKAGVLANADAGGSRYYI